MFCKYCGKTLKDGLKFCKYCGKQLGKNTKAEPKQMAPMQPVASPVQHPLQQTKPEEKPKKRLSTGAIIGIIAGCVAVAIVLVLVLTLGDKPPSRDAAPIQQMQDTTQAPVQEQTKIVEEPVKTGNEQSETSDEVKVTKSDFYGEWLFVATRFDIDHKNDPNNNEEEGYGYLLVNENSMTYGFIHTDGEVSQTVSSYLFKYDESLKKDERFKNTSYSYFIEYGIDDYRFFIDRDGYLVLCQFEDNKYFGNVQIFEKQPEGTIESLKNK